MVEDLQRRAGNQAVGALLGPSNAAAAHSPVDVFAVQRAGGPENPVAEPAGAETTSGTATMTIPSLDLVVAIDSMQFSSGPTSRGREGESSAPREVSVGMRPAAFDPRLAQAANEGRAFDRITIMVGAGLSITLRAVLISHMSMTQDAVVLTLSAESMEQGPGT
jgi:hypothetical protein